MKEYIKVLNFQPHNLPLDYISDPELGIANFFCLNPLSDVRHMIQVLLKSWLRDRGTYPDRKSISEMLFFTEQLIEVIEVSYVKGRQDGYLTRPANLPKG